MSHPAKSIKAGTLLIKKEGVERASYEMGSGEHKCIF